MRITRIALAICTVLAITSLFSLCSSKTIIIPSQPQYVIIDFHFDFVDLDGHWTNESYSGGWFSYNISLTNIGSLNLNATYTVTVYNPDNTVNGYRDFPLNLKPHQSGCLYPNQTLIVPEGIKIDNSSYRAIFFTDTAGAYKVNVTANTPITYLRLAKDNVTYNTMFDSYQIAFDAMPSYQEKINDETNKFYENNTDYFKNFKDYEDAVTLQASNAEKLSTASLFIGILAVAITFYSEAKKELWNTNSVAFLIFLSFLVTVMVLYIYPNYGWGTLMVFAVVDGYAIFKFVARINGKQKREEKNRNTV